MIEIIKTDKKVLDPSCGSKMFWFNKNNPDTIYGDIRSESHILCDGRTLNINPDVLMDFRQMPFLDNQFALIVFDPPHLKNLGHNSWMAKKYGILNSTWEKDIKLGFDECWRVLKNEGTLIFKWNENQIPKKKILEVIGKQPLFGHTSGRHEKTIWMTFFKNINN